MITQLVTERSIKITGGGAREAAILRVLNAHCQQGGRERILDIGCGDGLLFDRLARFGDVQGVEVCGNLVSQDNPWRSKIYVGPFDERYQPGGRFSLILMLDVLEHFADPLAALRHVDRLLAPEGLVLIHVPAFRSLWTSHDDLNHHYTRYTEESLRHVLSEASLDVASIQYTFYWTCPIKMAIRIKERLFFSLPKQPHVPSPLLNGICYYLSRAEQFLFRHRSPGFGSSILAMAKHSTSHEVHVEHEAPGVAQQHDELCEV